MFEDTGAKPYKKLKFDDEVAEMVPLIPFDPEADTNTQVEQLIKATFGWEPLGSKGVAGIERNIVLPSFINSMRRILNNSSHQDKTIDEIFSVMQRELGDAWERYEGSDDDLDGYGELYDNAYYKAKDAIQAVITKAENKARVDELAIIRERNIDYRVAMYVDKRVEELESTLPVDELLEGNSPSLRPKGTKRSDNTKFRKGK